MDTNELALLKIMRELVNALTWTISEVDHLRQTYQTEPPNGNRSLSKEALEQLGTMYGIVPRLDSIIREMEGKQN